jgi:adenylate cyclase
VTSIAGDGIMSVFGLDGDAAAAARNALTAAESVWRLVDQLSEDFAEELGALKFGIGVHTGLSVIGRVGLPGQTSIQFLGDTGNIASRLESLTKETACTMIVSASAIAAAGMSTPGWLASDLEIRGRSELLPAFLVFDRDELASIALAASS